MLYIGVADGGSGGDPLDHAQNLTSLFGKLLRIDPLGRNSANGKYGIPASNPLAGDDHPATLGEIYAYGLRNPQHIAWDRTTGRMFVTDIGQGTVEEINVVTPGANLGWNQWEGSFRFEGGRGGVSTENPRSDPEVTYPVAEYDQTDPLLGGRVAVTGLAIYRGDEVGQINGAVLFGDLPNGEVFAISADHPPSGGQAGMRRVLFNDGGEAKTFLAILQEKNAEQGKERATRADLRFYPGNGGRVYLLNKADGVIRVLVP
jgi:glucose/arabinose dehydrogenase